MKDGDVMDEVHSQNSVFSLITDCMSDSGQINLNAVKSYEQIVFMGDSLLMTPTWLSLEKYFSTKVYQSLQNTTLLLYCTFCVEGLGIVWTGHLRQWARQ